MAVASSPIKTAQPVVNRLSDEHTRRHTYQRRDPAKCLRLTDAQVDTPFLAPLIFREGLRLLAPNLCGSGGASLSQGREVLASIFRERNPPATP
jgi:hypothetical protein